MADRKKKTLALAGLFVLAIVFSTYALFQAREYLLGPSVEIVEPKNYEIAEKKIITVYGKIERASFVTLNGKDIFIEANGILKEEIALQKGYNFIKIWVKDRFGREKTETLIVSLSEENEKDTTGAEAMSDETNSNGAETSKSELEILKEENE